MAFSSKKSEPILVFYDQSLRIQSSLIVKPFVVLKTFREFVVRYVLPLCGMIYVFSVLCKIVTVLNTEAYVWMTLASIFSTPLFMICGSVYSCKRDIVKMDDRLSYKENMRRVHQSFDNRYHTVLPGIPSILKPLFVGGKARQADSLRQRKYDAKVALAAEATGASHRLFGYVFCWGVVVFWIISLLVILTTAEMDGYDPYEFMVHHPRLTIVRHAVFVLWFPTAFHLRRHGGFVDELHSFSYFIHDSCKELSAEGGEGKERLREWVENILISDEDSDFVKMQKMELVVQPIWERTHMRGLARCVPSFLPGKRCGGEARDKNGIWAPETKCLEVAARKRAASCVW